MTEQEKQLRLRYIRACVRASCVGDEARMTDEEVIDVWGLIRQPSVDFDRWVENVGITQAVLGAPNADAQANEPQPDVSALVPPGTPTFDYEQHNEDMIAGLAPLKMSNVKVETEPNEHHEAKPTA